MNEFEKLVLEQLETIGQRMDHVEEEIGGVRKEVKEIQGEIKKLQNDVEVLKIKQDLTQKKLDDLTLNVKISERAIRSDIRKLQDGQETIITILDGNDLLPKMN